jgi:hypothetical protein
MASNRYYVISPMTATVITAVGPYADIEADLTVMADPTMSYASEQELAQLLRRHLDEGGEVVLTMIKRYD